MVKGLRGSLPEQEDLGSKPAFSNYKVKGGRKKLRTCQIVWCQRAHLELQFTIAVLPVALIGTVWGKKLWVQN